MCGSMVGLDIQSAAAEIRRGKKDRRKKKIELECEPMPDVMVALPNIGGTLCSTPQSLADAHALLDCRAVNAVTQPRRERRWN